MGYPKFIKEKKTNPKPLVTTSVKSIVRGRGNSSTLENNQLTPNHWSLHPSNPLLVAEETRVPWKTPN